MLRRFVKDSLTYGVSNVLIRATSFLLLPFYTRVLSPTDYGIIDYLRIVEALLAVTLALEITQGLARFYPDAESDHERVTFASTTLWFTVAVYSALTLVAWALAAPLTGALLGPAVDPAIVRAAAIAFGASGVFYAAVNQLRWQLDSRAYALVAFVASLSQTLATIGFVLGAGMGVQGIFYGQLIGSTVGLSMSIWRGRRSFGGRFHLGAWRSIVAFSLPLVPSSLGVFLAAYVDRVTIKALLDLESLGLYGVGFRIASIITLTLTGIQVALTPLVMSHYREPETPAKLARLFRYFLAGAIGALAAMILGSPELVAFLAAPEFARATILVPMLAPAALLGGMYIFAPGLLIAKRTGIVAAINLGGGLLNAALNVGLIMIIGLPGAALGTLVSAACVFVAHLVASQRTYPVPHDWQRILGALAAAAALLAAWPLLDAGLSHWLGSWTKLTLKATIAVGLAILVTFILIGRRELADLRKLVRQKVSGADPVVAELPETVGQEES